MDYSSHCFSVSMAVELGGVEKALILQHFHFWVQHNEQNKDMCRDGHTWFFCSRAAMRKTFPYISDHCLRTIIDKLYKEGYIIKGNYSDKLTNKSSWYSLSEKALSLFDGGVSPLDKMTNGLDKSSNGLDEMANDIDSNKDNKKDITSIVVSLSKNNVSLFGACGETDCPEEPNRNHDKHAKKEGANARVVETFEQRVITFKQKCYAFAQEFGDVLVEDFFLYWSETKEGGHLMRWEKEPTFDIRRRLCRWRSNNFGNKYGVKVAPPKEREMTPEEIDEIMNWRRND